MKEKMQTIYYRGFLKSCNYHCSYCAFVKGCADEEEIRREERGLRSFYQQISKRSEPVEILFTPYGEGLIHEIYQETMAALSALPQVRAVGIQTNLSLEPEGFLRLLRERGEPAKIRLWATYHAEMAERQSFLDRVKHLAGEVKIAVGMVATLANEEEIRQLRVELPPEIYLWLNAMDRRKAAFSPERIERLQEIDPMFAYEFADCRRRSMAGKGFAYCAAVENVYMDRGSRQEPCFFQRAGKKRREACHEHRLCDCYLGYSNFTGSPLARFFDVESAFRIPLQRKWQAIFLDFDGVLTDKAGRLIPGISEFLTYLEGCARLYLITARSYLSVRRALAANFRFFSGGVFFDGAYVLDKDMEMTFPIEPSLEEKFFCSLTEKRRKEGRQIEEKLERSLEETATCPSGENMMAAEKGTEVTKARKMLSGEQPANEKELYAGGSMDLRELPEVLESLWRPAGILEEKRQAETPDKELEWTAFNGKGKAQFQKGELLRLQMPTAEARKLDVGLLRRQYGERTYFQSSLASKKNGIEQLRKRWGWTREEILVMTDNPQDEELLQDFPYTAAPLHRGELAEQAYYAVNAAHLPFISARNEAAERRRT